MSRDELIALVWVQAEQLTTMAGQFAQVVAANEQLSAVNAELAAKLAKVEHLLSRNSGNSSSPPSRDGDPGRTPPPETKGAVGSGRKRGKQPGAAGSTLGWTENPDERLDRFPRGSCECGADLAGATDLGVSDRYQQHEIPLVVVRVTQYDQHAVRCGCGRLHTAERPQGARGGVVEFGPNLQAWVVYLMVVHFLPAQRCAQLLGSMTGAAPSVGFVHGMLARAARLLAEADTRIRALVTLAYAVCCDETVRHEAPCDRVEVRGLHRPTVAAVGLKLRAA
jgi:transposase